MNRYLSAEDNYIYSNIPQADRRCRIWQSQENESQENEIQENDRQENDSPENKRQENERQENES